MELNVLILLLLMTLPIIIVWRIAYHKTITLCSPIFRNTAKKEIGAWAYYKMKLPVFPYPRLLLHDGNGGIYRIREVQYDKGSKEIFCRTYLDQPFCDNEDQYEHMKKHAISFGWKVREVEPHILLWWKDEYEIIGDKF